jgi:uncharacterized membrane protein
MRNLAWLKDRNDREWFPNVPAQMAAVLGFGVFALLGVSGLLAGKTSGDRMWGMVLLVFGVVFVGRSLVAPSLEVNPRALVLRKVFRTRVLAWDDVAQITIEEGSTGMFSGEREFVVVQMKDATTWRHTELNAPIGRRHRSPCRVHDAVTRANYELRGRR